MATQIHHSKSYEAVSKYFAEAKHDAEKLERLTQLLRVLSKESDSSTNASLLRAVDITKGDDPQPLYDTLQEQLRLVTSTIAMKNIHEW